MAKRSCYDCVYAWFDAERWLRDLYAGRPLVPMCANHPSWPGELHDVPGVPCCHFRPRHVEPIDNVKRIPMGDGRYALVDAADYEWLNQYQWHLCGGGYAARCEKGKRILMHREIMKPPRGMVVDHIDANRSNNCRVNLRVCTPGENQRNQRKQRGSACPYKGVGYLKNCKRCHAKLVFEGETVWLGHFDSEPEAARAYDRAAVEIFGEFARLNFPEEWPAKRREMVHANAKAERTNLKRRVRRKKAKATRAGEEAKVRSEKVRTESARGKAKNKETEGRRGKPPSTAATQGRRSNPEPQKTRTARPTRQASRMKK